MVCRGCNMEAETLIHVLGSCKSLQSSIAREGDEYSTELQTSEAVVDRVKEFVEKVDDVVTVDV